MGRRCRRPDRSADGIAEADVTADEVELDVVGAVDGVDDRVADAEVQHHVARELDESPAIAVDWSRARGGAIWVPLYWRGGPLLGATRTR